MLPTEPCKKEISLLFTFVQMDNSHVSYNSHVGHEVPGAAVWPWLLYCEMLRDISSYRATLQSEGK